MHRIWKGRAVALLMAAFFPMTPKTLAALQPPPQPPPVQMEIQPGNVAIISVFGYVTAGAAPGQFFACAFKRVGPITGINGLQLFVLDTNGNAMPLPGVNFQPNANTTTFFNNSQGGAWNGFHSQITQNIPPGLPLKLVFMVNLQPGTTDPQLAGALSMGFLGSDEAGPAGMPTGARFAVVPLGPITLGSVTLMLPAGVTTIANNFNYPMDNTVARVLTNLPPGSAVGKYNAASQQYESPNVFNPGAGGWANPSQTIGPREGAWLYTPSPVTLRFSGNVPPTPGPQTRPAPGFYFVSCPMAAPATFEQLMGFPPVVGDKVFKYDNTLAMVPPPGQDASGVHTFGPSGWDTVPVVFPGKSAFVQLINTNPAPVLNSIPSTIVHAGMAMQFTVTATDAPPTQLSFSLEPGAPATALIDSLTGAFSWATTDTDAESVHEITVRVTDNGVPPLSATQMFSVVVLPRSQIEIHRETNAVTLIWSSIPGVTYQILQSENVLGPWSPLGPGIVATNLKSIFIDAPLPVLRRFYRITNEYLIPVYSNPVPPSAFCVLVKNTAPGPGITATLITPTAGETMLMSSYPMPFIVKGEDRDKLIHGCVCFFNGGLCAKSTKYDIMDTVKYRWTLYGLGELQGDGPAVLYAPPHIRIGETNIDILTVTITDGRDNDGTPLAVTYTNTIVREGQCQYRRTVATKVVGAPGMEPPVGGACDCFPSGGGWFAGPELTADAPAEIVAAAGQRIVLPATGADSDAKNLVCVSSACGGDTKDPELFDEMKYSWSAALGTFPDYSATPVSNSRRTSVIYSAPAIPGEDMVTIQVGDSGEQFAETIPPIQVKVLVRKIDLQIHKPPVLDTNQTMIPEADELCLGAQTFVNLDNDGQRVIFDIDSNGSRAVQGENEMVKLILRVESNRANGTARLIAPEGSEHIQVWTNAVKLGARYSLDTPLAVANEFTDTGTAWIKELWVEGLSAHTNQRQTVLKMIYEEKNLHAEDEAALTILGIDSLEWIGRNNSTNSDNTLDFDPRWPTNLEPRAVRVFPDARVVGVDIEADPRDRVDVKVTLTTKPIEPVNFYFRVFDVDDPTSADAPVDNENLDDDNRSKVLALTNTIVGAVNGIKELLFTEHTNTFEFQVTMQPGDNFRIVGNGDTNFLLALENRDLNLETGETLAKQNANKQRIINMHISGDPSDREIRLPEHYASRVLTVWRFLHVEVDSMGVVTNNFQEGNITALDTGISTTATRVSVSVSPRDGSPDADSAAPSNGRFENGMLQVAGTHTIGPLDSNGQNDFRRAGGMNVCATALPFTAADNDASLNSTMSGTVTAITGGSVVLTLNITAHSETPIDWPDFVGGTVRIGGGPAVSITAVDEGTSQITVAGLLIPYRVTDDDVISGDVPQPDTSGIAPIWAMAYVVPLFDTGKDSPDVPFVLNSPDADQVAHINSGKGSPLSTDRYWVVSVLNGYQTALAPDAGQQGDNDSDTEGTDRGVSYFAVHGVFLALESIRDWIATPAAKNGGNGMDPASAGRQPRYQEILNHEIGHQFGQEHPDGRISPLDPLGGVDAPSCCPPDNPAMGTRGTNTFSQIGLDKIRSRGHPGN